MIERYKFGMILLIAACLSGCATGSKTVPAADQNPSPMQEHTRSHARIAEATLPGVAFTIDDVLPRPASVYVPPSVTDVGRYDLLIHFHGAAFVVNTAVSRLDQPMVAISIHLGAGSSVYERPFLDESAFPRLLQLVKDSLVVRGLSDGGATHVYLSAFSAGYGAVRAILTKGMKLVDGVLLLDGLHTDYVPDRVVLSEGGRLEEAELVSFLEFARMAVDGRRTFVITHSEIFPGTFASTTETTDYIIRKMGLTRQPVLEWGPGGMQLLSRTKKGRFTILGFAGNTAPDHVDHFHGLPEFLELLIGS